jgi:hypothetical protein
MSNVLLSIYKYLPTVLIHKIIHYTDVIVYRHGKYINRIDKNDERYRVLQPIPKPIKVYKNNILHKIILKLLNINMPNAPMNGLLTLLLEKAVKTAIYQESLITVLIIAHAKADIGSLNYEAKSDR